MLPAILVLLPALLTQGAPAIASAPALTVTRVLTAHTAAAKLESVGWFGVHSNGAMALFTPETHAVQLYGADGKRGAMVLLADDGPPIKGPTAGWVGDTLWVASLAARKIYLLPPHGSEFNSRSSPAVMVLPSDEPVEPEGTLTLPLRVMGMLGDGSLLVSKMMPAVDTAMPAWRRPARSRIGYAKVTSDGVLREWLAWVPPVTRCRPAPNIPPLFCNVPWAAVSSDGRFAASVASSISGSDSGSFRVIAIDSRGDTTFDRAYGYAATPIPRSVIDSARESTLTDMRKTAPRLADSAERVYQRSMVTVFPPFAGVLVGRDGTVWIAERPTAVGRTWVELDPHGAIVGRITVGGTVHLRAVSRSEVWGLDARDRAPVSIVAYRVAAP
ncbi:MAG TPA: hypothetical protein VGM77_00230 [Gemmatimonadales bacterium]|jgi:hypothetical protein